MSSVCCCQPEAVSLVNVTCASCWPVELQIVPMCVPVSSGDFQKRNAVIDIGMSKLIFVPSS